jgi:ribosomal protein S18 acetylase RimI-like enzyme
MDASQPEAELPGQAPTAAAAPAVTIEIGGRRALIRPLRDLGEAAACARIMSTTEPWITLGRDFDSALGVIAVADRETYVAVDDEGVAGFVVIQMRGAFVGYVQSIAVRAESRSQGLGRQLLRFAEERILRETPNVFLCVSSFNARARSFYERLGYELVGELRDFVVAGHAELLMRKSTGPLRPGVRAGRPPR